MSTVPGVWFTSYSPVVQIILALLVFVNMKYKIVQLYLVLQSVSVGAGICRLPAVMPTKFVFFSYQIDLLNSVINNMQFPSYKKGLSGGMTNRNSLGLQTSKCRLRMRADHQLIEISLPG